jgi:putative methyltransferase (TIGR04325 family)
MKSKYFSQFCPPIIANSVNKIRNRRYTNKFVKNNSAFEFMNQENGYASDAIINKIYEASLQVKEGKSTFQRDGYSFKNIQYDHELLFSLLFAAANKSVIRVIDYGGGLGATYYQNQNFLKAAGIRVIYEIVEQPKLVRIGKLEFENSHVYFNNSISEALLKKNDMAIFNGSIQYSESPQEILEFVIKHNIRTILLNNIPTIAGNEHQLYMEYPASHLYGMVSYPVWFLSRSGVIEQLGKGNFELVISWRSNSQPYVGATTEGFLFQLKI